jgi:transposase
MAAGRDVPDATFACPDLTAVRGGTGPARLLDMDEVVAMDGFTGFKTATAEELSDAAAVMDPFHLERGK